MCQRRPDDVGLQVGERTGRLTVDLDLHIGAIASFLEFALLLDFLLPRLVAAPISHVSGEFLDLRVELTSQFFFVLRRIFGHRRLHFLIF